MPSLEGLALADTFLDYTAQISGPVAEPFRP